LRTISAAVTDIGLKRAANEDFFAVDEAKGVYVVADGLGGHVAGRTASETAVGAFLGRLAESDGDPIMAQMRTAMRGANAAILQKGRELPYLRGMGTTMAALWLHGQHATIAHVGDSRIYLLRHEVLYPLTLDHSYVCELVFRRRLKPSAARSHPSRHVITRALGVFPPAEPDASQLLLEPGDLFVLCTDGITGPISDDELYASLRQGLEDIDGSAKALVDTANARGGHDNSTLILVRVWP